MATEHLFLSSHQWKARNPLPYFLQEMSKPGSSLSYLKSSCLPSSHPISKTRAVRCRAGTWLQVPRTTPTSWKASMKGGRTRCNCGGLWVRCKTQHTGNVRAVRSNFDSILGKMSFLQEWSGTGPGCPEQGWSPHPWRGSKNVWMWHLGRGLAGMGVLGWRLDLMIFEIFSNLHDSMKQWWKGSGCEEPP